MKLSIIVSIAKSSLGHHWLRLERRNGGLKDSHQPSVHFHIERTSQKRVFQITWYRQITKETVWMGCVFDLHVEKSSWCWQNIVDHSPKKRFSVGFRPFMFARAHVEFQSTSGFLISTLHGFRVLVPLASDCMVTLFSRRTCTKCQTSCERC